MGWRQRLKKKQKSMWIRRRNAFFHVAYQRGLRQAQIDIGSIKQASDEDILKELVRWL